ncbi:MAG: glutathione S-transferase family protein [Myxococcales bacterium]|nr:glutathione S-transferase family protein [Myxococcales bacterium]
MKLYYHPFSNFARKVRMVLIEKGITVEPVVVDLLKGAQKSPEYLAKNPLGKVPTLEVDGNYLCESTVINEYLEETHPEPRLLPKDPIARARARLIDEIHDAYLVPAMGPAFLEHFKPEDKRVVETIRKGRESGRKYLEILDGMLKGREYFCGEFSLADIAVAPTIQFVDMMFADELEPHANLRAWYARVSQRPSFQKTTPGTPM